MSIIVDRYSAVLIVDSVHGDSLEFVLYREFDKLETFVTNDYMDSLCNMLDESGITVDETQVYGDVQFQITAYSIAELQHAIEISKTVVARWLKEYNINEMERA